MLWLVELQPAGRQLASFHAQENHFCRLLGNDGQTTINEKLLLYLSDLVKTHNYASLIS